MTEQKYSREQVDDITAPWLSMCKEQGERIAELEAQKTRSQEHYIKLLRELDADLAALLEAARRYLPYYGDEHSPAYRKHHDRLAALLQGEGGECLHRFMYFGDQKKRRCADCNIQE